jgi:predicted PurR-regulated permease PerM
MVSERDAASVTRRVILALLLGGLFVLGYLVLNWFIVPAVWATILAYVTWPAYARLRRLLRGHAMTSALLMTMLLTAAFVLPLLWLTGLLQAEFVLGYQAVSTFMAGGTRRLPEFVARLPWLGERLQDLLDKFATDPAALRALTGDLEQQWLGALGDLVGGVAQNAVKLGFALLTFCSFTATGKPAQSGAARIAALPRHASMATSPRSAPPPGRPHGLVLTAFAQGLLAGVGYWFAGVRAPVLFARSPRSSR